MKRVLMLDPLAASELDLLRSLDPDGALDLHGSEDPAEIMALLPGSQMLVSRKTPVTAEHLLTAGPALQLVQAWSNRLDRIDLTAAAERGVAVRKMPLVGCVAVAELTFLLMLGLSKKIAQAHADTVQGRYRDVGAEPVLTSERLHKFQWMGLPDLFELNGKTLGLVGFGEIAGEVARRARAFGMRVLYSSRQPLPDAVAAQEEVEYRPLEEVLAESDIVSLHVPHTAQTEGMIDRAALRRMQPHAFLINTCRGGVVNEGDLVEALRAGVIAGAGLDVFRYEPIPFDHPLLELPNVLLTPHLGGGSGGARVKQARDLIHRLQRWPD
ncbi:2-hydroxyacid dehydrogenase [Deinococcus sp. UYEF24]